MNNEKKPQVFSKIIWTVFYDFYSLGLSLVTHMKKGKTCMEQQPHSEYHVAFDKTQEA